LAEATGDVLGRRAGEILVRFMEETIDAVTARTELRELLCSEQCDVDAERMCCVEKKY
jgi:hypothetical protein